MAQSPLVLTARDGESGSSEMTPSGSGFNQTPPAAAFFSKCQPDIPAKTEKTWARRRAVLTWTWDPFDVGATCCHFWGGIVSPAPPASCCRIAMTEFPLLYSPCELPGWPSICEWFLPGRAGWGNVPQASVLILGPNLVVHHLFYSFDPVALSSSRLSCFLRVLFGGAAGLQVVTALLSDTRPVVLTLKYASKSPGGSA